MPNKFRLRHRRGNTAAWEASDVVLLDGEIAIEDCIDGRKRLLVGDGEHTYLELPKIYLPNYEDFKNQVEYCGTFDGSMPTTVGIEENLRNIRKGDYFVAINTVVDSDGTQYDAGDWAVYNGVGWDKVLNNIQDVRDGREILLQTNATHIQWKYTDDENWTDLIALSELSGESGLNSYIYIKYSSSPNGSDFTNSPDVNTTYMGICITDDNTAPVENTSYSWVQIKGTDGQNSYIHIKYSNSSDGADFTDDPTINTAYMGICVTIDSVAPTLNTSYDWVRIRGVDGTGEGGASVGIVTATVDNNVGTPSVSVVQSDNNLTFAFSNLKGNNGAQGANGNDGKSISSIVKTSTSGLTDTYTITFTDNTTTTFDVVNGAVGAMGITFTPSVSNEGVISWTNDGEASNPAPVNISERWTVVTSTEGTSLTPANQTDYVLTNITTLDITVDNTVQASLDLTFSTEDVPALTIAPLNYSIVGDVISSIVAGDRVRLLLDRGAVYCKILEAASNE